jgi:hypothetical protein
MSSLIYWKKTGLLHTKISNHNIIYSSQKPRKSSSLPLKSSSWLFSLDAGTGIYKFGNNTNPRGIRRRSNLGHIFGKKCVLWDGKYGIFTMIIRPKVIVITARSSLDKFLNMFKAKLTALEGCTSVHCQTNPNPWLWAYLWLTMSIPTVLIKFSKNQLICSTSSSWPKSV